MNLLGIVVNALVISAVGSILAWLSHGRFRAIEVSIHRVEGRLDNRSDALQSAIEGLRSDLTAVALAVARIRGVARVGRTGSRCIPIRVSQD